MTTTTTLSKVQKIIAISNILCEGEERDLIKFLKNQESCRLKWQRSEHALKSLKDTDGPLRDENKSLSVQLELARNQLDSALRKRPMYEKRIQLLEQQLHAISELLNDADPAEFKKFDRNTILRMTSIGDFKEITESPHKPSKPYCVGRKSVIPSDFDDSEEETIHTHLTRAASTVRSLKRKISHTEENENASFQEPEKSPKLAKNTESDSVTVTTIPPTKEPEHQLPKPIIPKVVSEKPEIPKKCDEIKPELPSKSKVYEIYEDTIPPPSTFVQPSAPSWDSHPASQINSADKPLYPDIDESIPLDESTILNNSHGVSKPHNMIQKKEIKPGKCSICQKGIGFQKVFYRCQDCNIKCHEECKSLISSSCTSETNRKKLSDFIDSSSLPRIPSIITQCIKEIERRGLSHQGLYRISGSVKEVKEFKTKWERREEINLTKISDIHLMTSLLKTFLRSLNEPLITRRFHNMFLKASESNDLPRIYKLIDNLPLENRHTLSFMMLHLRRVARVQENLMDFKSLSRVLGPTIVGNGCLNPTGNQLYQESLLQPVLLETFLGLSDDYWHLILESRDSNTCSDTMLNDTDKTKQDSSITDSPLLGRIDGITSHHKNLPRRTKPPAPKPLMEKLGKKKFFDTPMLKR